MELKLFIAGCIFLVLAVIMQIVKKKFIKGKPNRVFEDVYSWVDTLWTALIIASVIMYFFLQAFKIPTGSMRMTLLEKDHLFALKCVYGLRVPFTDGKRVLPIKQVKRGDVVIFQCPPSALSYEERTQNVKKDYIKRCVALAGDKVEIRNKMLYVNDVLAEEDYVNLADVNMYPKIDIANSSEEYQTAWEKGEFALLPVSMIRDNFGPVIVPEGHYMVLGDNRDYSFDARFWGPLPDKYLKGQAFVVYWPLNRIKLIK